MKKRENIIIASLMLILCTFGLQAQTYQVSGRVLDSLETPMTGATVMLLQKQDSVLQAFSIVGDQGQYIMRNVPSGDYLLTVSFLGYENFQIPLPVDADQSPADILLSKENTLLNEVLVKDEIIPIRINNDTVEYNARAFGTQANAKVEDLLKRLPGVEVDRDGNIKAQGEDVNRVLVDGKEFFGDDPKMATKNLPADIVDKVQVFDKASDFAEFSGIEDGQEEKTINLKLKEDKKNGYFGEVAAEYGTDDRYQGRLSLNRFGGKSQISVLANSNNINEQAFSFMDYLNFMGGFQALAQGGRISLDSDEMGLPQTGPGSGITTGTSGGINFNQDFSDRTELRSSYFYGRTRNTRINETIRQNFLDDGVFESNNESVNFGGSDNHSLNLNLRHKVDSSSRINVRSNVRYGDFFSDQSGSSENFSPDGNLQNKGINNYRSNGQNFNLTSSANYQKRLKKIGRTISIASNIGLDDRKSEGHLESQNSFFENNQISRTDSIDQLQLDKQQEFNWGSRFSYTEPIGKGQFLELNTEYQRFNNDVDRSVFDIAGLNEQIPNSQLSNAYERLYQFTRTGANYRLNRDDFKFSTGLQVQASKLSGKLISLNSTIDQNFTNVLPRLSFQYDFESSTNIRFNYSTNVREPSLQELQPVVDNSDPLNIYIGNPDLRPEYNHRLSLNFFSFSAFTFTSFFANLQASYTENKITDAKTIDQSFIQTTRPVNVDQDFSLNGTINFSTPLRFMKAKINLTTNQTFSRSILLVNEQENQVGRWINRVGMSIENRKKKVFDLRVGLELDYNQTVYSETENLDQQFLTQDYYSDFDINFLKRFQFGSSFTYSLFGGNAFEATEAFALWEADLSLFVLKDKKGMISFSVFDILNQNQGITRSSNFNYIEDRRTNNLSRYFMVGFSYNLSGFGKSNPNQMDIQVGGSGRRRR